MIEETLHDREQKPRGRGYPGEAATQPIGRLVHGSSGERQREMQPETDKPVAVAFDESIQASGPPA